MLDRKTMIEILKPTLRSHATKKAKSIQWGFIDGNPLGKNMFGCSVDPDLFEGKVIEITDQVVIVKPKPNLFYILDKSLMAVMPQLGDKVEVIPYFRKEFDGQRLGETVKKDTQFMDGLFLNADSCILGDNVAHIPGAEVRNQELRSLVNYLQTQILSDGYRHITHLMVDAGASNIIAIDPVTGSSDKELPSIKFNVSSTRFEGSVHIVYHYSSDTFSVGFYNNEVKIIEDVHFNELAGVIEAYLDDISYKQIKINVLSKQKHSAA